MKVWPFKHPGERIPVTFTYPRLARGATLQAWTITLTVLEGTDANPQTMFDGDPSVTGNKVSQWIRGGVDGTAYKATCVVSCSDGTRFVAGAILPVSVKALDL